MYLDVKMIVQQFQSNDREPVEIEYDEFRSNVEIRLSFEETRLFQGK